MISHLGGGYFDIYYGLPWSTLSLGTYIEARRHYNIVFMLMVSEKKENLVLAQCLMDLTSLALFSRCTLLGDYHIIC